MTITGYLRITEPGGGFLRSNDPATGKWYSRDVAAIAAARGLSNVAPYFVDADKSGVAAPIGGLTIIAFPNNHLVYMLTWFALAAMTVVAFVVFVRQDARRRRGGTDI
jgi:surfeit locus 1 family protein